MADTTDPLPLRQSRTVGYHNSIGDISAGIEDHGAPPTYTSACAPQTLTRLRATSNPEPLICEALPHYACSLSEAAPVDIRYERTSPFSLVESSQWSEAYLVLRGTRLSVHEARIPSLFSAKGKAVVAGKLTRSYSLQHAEVGVASDCKKYELVSRSPMTAFLPLSMQEKMKETEPHLFEPVRQYILRLRVETDQILIRVRSWEARATWIDKLCAAVDIAPPIEERSEPTNHTLPRRRRRAPRTNTGLDSARARLLTLVEDQQRIIRERFPHLLEAPRGEEQAHVGHHDVNDTVDPDAEDLDTGIVRGEDDVDDREGPEEHSSFMHRLHRFVQQPLVPAHPHPHTQPHSHLLTQPHLLSTSSPHARPRLHPPLTSSAAPTAASGATHPSRPSTSNSTDTATSANGKPKPTPQLDLSQDARYRRRCMPTLLINSRRANDIIISHGARWKIDWATSSLRPYPERPPPYAGEDAEGAEPFVPRPTPARPALKTSKSATTVNESAESSVEESPSARRLLKDTMGSWGRKIRIRRREGVISEGSGVEEKLVGTADDSAPPVQR